MRGGLEAHGLVAISAQDLLVDLLDQHLAARRLGTWTRLQIAVHRAVDLGLIHGEHGLFGEPVPSARGQVEAVPDQDLVQILELIVLQDLAELYEAGVGERGCFHVSKL